MLGWVEVYKGNNFETFRRFEQALCDHSIKYRSYELNHANKTALVGMQFTPQAVSRGPSFNPSGLYDSYSEKNESPIYTLLVKHKDMDKFHALGLGR